MDPWPRGRFGVSSTIGVMPVSLDDELLRDSFVESIDPLLAAESPQVGLGIETIGLAALQQSRQAVCITDAQVDLPGPAISFVNSAYTEIFRCDADQVIGRSPRIGQGPLTNRRVLDRLRAHIEVGESVQAQAINYRFDRTAFRLRWSIDPITRNGVVVGFFAQMRDVTPEDRMRRRLAALDTLMSRGKVASRLGRAERLGPVAQALASALRPLVAEIGSASVRIGDAHEATQIDANVLDDCVPDIVETSIGTIGSISVSTHPDAVALVDHLAIGELGEHARWLLELGEPGESVRLPR
jgi:PAS domain S-box-containing protein